MSKLLERLVRKKVIAIIEQKEGLLEEQYKLRKRKSTADAMCRIQEIA